MATFLWRMAWNVQSVFVGVCPSETQLHGTLFYFPLVPEENVTESFILNNSNIMSFLLKGSSTQEATKDFFYVPIIRNFMIIYPLFLVLFLTLAHTALPRYS